MKFNFENKNVLITGAGSWLGQDMAIRFAKLGAHVSIAGRNMDALENTKELAGKAACNIEPAMVNITYKEKLAQYISTLDNLDVIVANAAIYPSGTTETGCEDTWQDVINTNLTSVYNLMKYTIPLLKKNDKGRVILISSVAGDLIGIPSYAAYGASKAGLNGLMRSLAVELAPYNITVNSILPGNFINQERFKVPDEDYQAMLDKIPLNRTGTPEDLANLVTFLGSEHCGFITGQTFVIDGGETII